MNHVCKICFLFFFILFNSIGRWLVPPKPPKPKPFSQRIRDFLPHQFSMMYIRNNKQFLSFVLIFVVLINTALFAARAYYFRDFLMLDGVTPNFFYILSRANGKIIFIISNCSVLFVKI